MWISLALGLYAAYNKRRADLAEGAIESAEAKTALVKEEVKLDELKNKSDKLYSDLDDFKRDFERKYGHKPGE